MEIDVRNGTNNSQAGCTDKQWRLLPAEEAEVAALAGSTAVPRVIARLLWLRDVRTGDQAERFFTPSLADLHDPALLCGMKAAVARLIQAVQKREPILIYGDYDVDGTLATVLLKTAIDRVTPRDTPSLVRFHIPHRIREGYGVQASVLAEAADAGVRLVVSVDTGIRAFAAANEARRLGLDLIVTDHHLPEQNRVPDAVAVINPNQPACTYPEKHLCGAAVAYKVAEALLRAAAESPSGLHPVEPASLQRLRASLLKLVAIATVADAVPLTGENRAIVAIGMAELRVVHQPGLRALLRLAQVGGDGRAPQAQDVAFRIAPRINAAGRMDVAGDVVRLLLTRDVAEAEALALKLHTLNKERRDIEASILLQIHEQVQGMLDAADAKTPDIFVVDGQDWHRGVVGILASRVVDRTHRPALVITHQDGAAHGSGRSVHGFHLLDALTAAHCEHLAETNEELLHRFGGHAHAVGFSLPSTNVTFLRERMLRLARGLTAKAGQPALEIDADLPLDDADTGMWEWICRLQPFGQHNAEPVFRATDLRVLSVRSVKEQHMRLRLKTPRGHICECVFWGRAFAWPERAAERGIAEGARIDLVYQLRWSDHPEFGGLQITGCDLRLRVVGESPAS